MHVSHSPKMLCHAITHINMLAASQQHTTINGKRKGQILYFCTHRFFGNATTMQVSSSSQCDERKEVNSANQHHTGISIVFFSSADDDDMVIEAYSFMRNFIKYITCMLLRAVFAVALQIMCCYYYYNNVCVWEMNLTSWRKVQVKLVTRRVLSWK